MCSCMTIMVNVQPCLCCYYIYHLFCHSLKIVCLIHDRLTRKNNFLWVGLKKKGVHAEIGEASQDSTNSCDFPASFCAGKKVHLFCGKNWTISSNMKHCFQILFNSLDSEKQSLFYINFISLRKHNKHMNLCYMIKTIFKYWCILQVLFFFSWITEKKCTL